MSSQKQETFEGIDFEAIKDITGLETDEIKVLKICFNMFDVKDQAFLSSDDLDDILRGMGFRPSKEELKDILEEIDEDGSGEIEFPEFCQLCAKFLVEEPDEDTMKAELKEAFRKVATLAFEASGRRTFSAVNFFAPALTLVLYCA
jgi:Ca2+-binding EF-hand superfamily protein